MTFSSWGLGRRLWLVRLSLFYIGELRLTRTIRRAAAAAAVAALVVLPMLVWAAVAPPLQPPHAAVALFDRAPWFFLSMPLVIVAVALSGVWRRYLEPRLTPRVFAGEPRAT